MKASDFAGWLVVCVTTIIGAIVIACVATVIIVVIYVFAVSLGAVF